MEHLGQDSVRPVGGEGESVGQDAGLYALGGGGVPLQLVPLPVGADGVDHHVGRLLRTGDGDEEEQLSPVGDEVLQVDGDTVVGLALADILDIVVFHRRLQAGGEGHGGGQLL